MREFGIQFEEGLRRGLRAFINPRGRNEQLVECFNMCPTETDLVGHRELESIGLAVPLVQYLAIRDQLDVVWYWIAGRALDTMVFDSVPNLLSSGFEVANVTPAIIPHWLEITAVDDPLVTLYMWPDAAAGDITVFTTPPPVGAGYEVLSGLELRSLSGYIHLLRAITSLDVYWSQVGV